MEPAHLAVARGEPPVAGHLQLVGLAAQHAQGQSGQPGWVPLAGDQRLDHRPAGLTQHVAGHRVDLDPGVFQYLGQPLPLAGALLDELLAIPRPLPQRCHPRVRDEAGPQQPVLVQFGDPLAVPQVRLAARDVAHVRRVAHAYLDPGLHQRMADRPPVHTRAFHRGVGHAQLRQPARHLPQRPPERLEPPHGHCALAGPLAGQPDRHPDHLLMHVDPGHPRMYDLHGQPPCFPPILDEGAPPAEPATRSRSCDTRSQQQSGVPTGQAPASVF